MRVVVIYREGQKLIKIALHLEYLGQATYLRPTMPWNASVCHSRQSSGHTMSSSFLMFATGEKSHWKNRQILREPNSRQFSAINPWQKFARSQNLHQTSLMYTLLKLLLHSADMYHFEARWTRQTLDNAEVHLETFQKLSARNLWKNQKTFG